MTASDPILPETVGQMAAQLFGLKLPADELQRVATLLNSLAVEMQAMRAMAISEQPPNQVQSPNQVHASNVEPPQAE